MSSFTLKILACIFMTIDHIGNIIFPDVAILRILGRIAFPIFAWQISIGCKNTSDIKKYIIRLAVFALISQIPYMFIIRQDRLNIFYTLALGALSIYAFRKIKNNVLGLSSVVFLMITASLLNFEYGAYGVATIFIFYLSFENILLMTAGQFIITGLYSIILTSQIQVYSLISIIPISCYNGKRGIKAKYLFYIFYPVHLIVLYVIKLLM